MSASTTEIKKGSPKVGNADWYNVCAVLTHLGGLGFRAITSSFNRVHLLSDTLENEEIFIDFNETTYLYSPDYDSELYTIERTFTIDGLMRWAELTEIDGSK